MAGGAVHVSRARLHLGAIPAEATLEGRRARVAARQRHAAAVRDSSAVLTEDCAGRWHTCTPARAHREPRSDHARLLAGDLPRHHEALRRFDDARHAAPGLLKLPTHCDCTWLRASSVVSALAMEETTNRRPNAKAADEKRDSLFKVSSLFRCRSTLELARARLH